jgi:hypothetical protein
MADVPRVALEAHKDELITKLQHKVGELVLDLDILQEAVNGAYGAGEATAFERRVSRPAVGSLRRQCVTGATGWVVRGKAKRSRSAASRR